MSEHVQPKPTWRICHAPAHGRIPAAERDALPATAFAFPRLRKEPMTDAAHVRDALARFNQVTGATDAERQEAFSNIQEAARHFGIQMRGTGWRRSGSPPRS
jgi:hypothetical protein